MHSLGEALKGSSLSFDVSANTLKCGFNLDKAVGTLGVKVLPSPSAIMAVASSSR